MKNRRILILFGVLLGVVIVVVLSSVVFTVKDVTVSISNAYSELNANAVEDKLSDVKGKNIIFLSEKDLSARIEREFPYAAVLGIEKKFPSTLMIRMRERYETYTVKYQDKYVHMDGTGLILKISGNLENPMPAGVVKTNVFVNLAEEEINEPVLGEMLSLQSGELKVHLLDQLFLQSQATSFEYRQLIKSVDLSVPGQAEIIFYSGAKYVFNSYAKELSSGADTVQEYCRWLYYTYELIDLADRKRAEFNFTVNAQGKMEIASNIGNFGDLVEQGIPA